MTSPRAAGGVPVLPSPIPTPGPIPRLYTRPCTPVLGVPETVYGTPGTCTYDRFWHHVGEPRGSRTHPYLGSQASYIQLLRFTRPFDWVFLRNRLVLLSLGPVLLSLGPVLLSLGPVYDLFLLFLGPPTCLITSLTSKPRFSHNQAQTAQKHGR